MRRQLHTADLTRMLEAEAAVNHHDGRKANIQVGHVTTDHGVEIDVLFLIGFTLEGALNMISCFSVSFRRQAKCRSNAMACPI